MASNTSNITKPSTAEQRDEVIGRGLTKQMNAGVAGICPSIEELAALIDGTLEGDAREQLMKHLAVCERCYEVFTTSQELLAVDEVPAKKRPVTFIASTIAVAAVIVVALTLSLQGNKEVKTDIATVDENKASHVPLSVAQPTLRKEAPLPVVAKTEGYVPPTASESVKRLVRPDNAGQLMESVSGNSSMYGFSGATAPDKVAFRLGVRATDLELLLRGNDRDAVTSQLKQVIELLRQVNKSSAEVTRLTEIMGRVEAGEALQGFDGCTAGLESVIATDAERFRYRFGVWAEGGRLASLAGNRAYVTAQSIRYVKDGVKGMQLPPGVSNALGEIEVVVGRGEFSEKDFAGMKRAFEDIAGMF